MSRLATDSRELFCSAGAARMYELSLLVSGWRIMKYEHTQKAPPYLVLVAIGLVMLASVWLVPDLMIQSILAIGGATFFLLSLTFQRLTVKGESNGLRISFGPLPLFRRFVLYENIDRVERSRTTFFDGWGIHLSPGGGWTWNLWGFDCVDVYFKKGGRVRIGTDDAEGLERFLKPINNGSQKPIQREETGDQP